MSWDDFTWHVTYPLKDKVDKEAKQVQGDYNIVALDLGHAAGLANVLRDIHLSADLERLSEAGQIESGRDPQLLPTNVDAVVHVWLDAFARGHGESEVIRSYTRDWSKTPTGEAILSILRDQP